MDAEDESLGVPDRSETPKPSAEAKGKQRASTPSDHDDSSDEHLVDQRQKAKGRARRPVDNDDFSHEEDTSMNRLHTLLEQRSTAWFTVCSFEFLMQFRTKKAELMMLDEPKKRRRVIDDDDEEEEDDLPLLRALQHLVAGRASEGDSVITIELTLPLSKDHWSGSLRIEFGGKAVEQKVDPVFEDPMHAIESASRAVMSSLSPMAPSPSALIQKKSDDEVSPADEGAVEVSVDGEVETGSMREVAFSGRHPERVLPFWRVHRQRLARLAQLVALVGALALWTMATDIIRRRQLIQGDEAAWYSVVERSERAGLVTLALLAATAYILV